MSFTDAELGAIHRRTLKVVIISQMMGGAGLAAGVTVGGLLAQDMLGGTSTAGLPAALFTLGSGLAAFLVGRYSQISGRRNGLSGGFAAGSVGAAFVVLAAVLSSPVLLFVSLFVYGSGFASSLQARYAGTDLAPETQRATAASVALLALTIGAVAGPNLVTPMGSVAAAAGIPRLAGPFMLAAVAYGLAGLILFIFMRPDPLLAARSAAAAGSGAAAQESTSNEPVAAAGRSSATALPPGLVAGATVMVLTQCTMIALMTMTPIHMRAHHHGVGQIGLVIGLHIAAMYLPSLLTGRLVDRIGRTPMAIAAALTLLAAGVVGAIAPGDSVFLLSLALILLGLGWNFGLIAGTALIVDSTTLKNRAQAQGSVDVLVALAGAGGGALSGLVLDLGSYQALTLGGGILALALIPVVVRYSTQTRTIAAS